MGQAIGHGVLEQLGVAVTANPVEDDAADGDDGAEENS